MAKITHNRPTKTWRRSGTIIEMIDGEKAARPKFENHLVMRKKDEKES